MRTLTTTALKAMVSARTNELFLTLLVINHDDWSAPVRLVNDTESVTSNSELYEPFGFTVVFPNESKDDPVSAPELDLDNVDREIIALLRSKTSGTTVSVSLIVKSEPDSVLLGPLSYSIHGWQTSGPASIKTTLTSDNILTERIPAHTFTPNNYTGLV